MSKFDNAEVLLDVQHLKQYFGGRRGVKAVDDVSFKIHKGEVLGVVGESGCGKTTTGRTIIKIYEATGGKVFFGGECISVGIQELKEQYKNAKNLTGKQVIALFRQYRISEYIVSDFTIVVNTK